MPVLATRSGTEARHASGLEVGDYSERFGLAPEDMRHGFRYVTPVQPFHSRSDAQPEQGERETDDAIRPDENRLPGGRRPVVQCYDTRVGWSSNRSPIA